ncbi:MAG: hypothetical protein K0Q95_140 [Bacteroidota bacterium]|jgi:hypothetical protein|nr:hypothetical protein [Bacteroidota bacterium]
MMILESETSRRVIIWNTHQDRVSGHGMTFQWKNWSKTQVVFNHYNALIFPSNPTEFIRKLAIQILKEKNGDFVFNYRLGAGFCDRIFVFEKQE